MISVATLNGQLNKQFKPEYIFRFYHSHLAVDYLTFECTRKCFPQGMCMYIFLSVQYLLFFFRFTECGKRLQIAQIIEICKTTRTNVFLDLMKVFCAKKRIFGVLEVILCLETFTNSALNTVLSANFRSFTCILNNVCGLKPGSHLCDKHNISEISISMSTRKRSFFLMSGLLLISLVLFLSHTCEPGLN